MTTVNEHKIQVKGMTCQHCVKAVTKAIQALDADAVVSVDLPHGTVTVQTNLPRETTTQAVTNEGYEVVV